MFVSSDGGLIVGQAVNLPLRLQTARFFVVSCTSEEKNNRWFGF